MDQLFEANVATAAPTNLGKSGYPTDGDPTSGTPPTIPGAYWFWMITAEILAVIVGAGLTPSGSMLNQLYQAIKSIANTAAGAVQAVVLGWFTGANVNTAANGYRLWPGSASAQMEIWLEIFCANAGNNLVTVTYPTPFFNGTHIPRVDCFDSTLTASTGQYFIKPTVISYSNTGCVVAMGANGGSARDVVLCVDVRGLHN